MQNIMGYVSEATSVWQGFFSANQSSDLAVLDVTSFGPLSGSGISNPIFQYSAGGNAVCVSGIVEVPVTTSAINFTYPGPKDNFELTELITDLFRVDSNAWIRYLSGEATISETFRVYSRLCIPKAGEHQTYSSVQFLTHGGTLDSSYWEFADDYSYVDAAAAKGYATFSYDRLGSGKSQHPDPIQVVQIPLQVDIAHILINKLKAGEIGGTQFKGVVAIGHSLGAGLTQGLSSRFPDDADAIILTGHGGFRGGMSTAFASAAWQIANTLPDRPVFIGLPNGYMSQALLPQALQFGFFFYPHFDPSIFEKEIRTRGTLTIGEFLTLGSLYAPVTAFTKPVLVLNGKQDFFYCQGDCDAEGDITRQALAMFYPDASRSSRAVTIPDVGHNINFHLDREKAFVAMLDFVQEIGVEP